MAMFKIFCISALITATGTAQVLAQASSATVDGKPITAAEMRLAEGELSETLANLDEAQRQKVLIGYLIEIRLLAAAAEREGLDKGTAYEQRMAYARMVALKEQYVASKITGTIGEREARRLYNEQASKREPQEEVRIRHVLVATKVRAEELKAAIATGRSLAELAKVESLDAGSSWNGGDIGYYAKGELEDRFEVAAFALPKGKISDPFETKFGWHLAMIEDRRPRRVPQFEEIKGDLIALLIQRKTFEVVTALRKTARVEIADTATSPAPAVAVAKPTAAPPTDVSAESVWSHNNSKMAISVGNGQITIKYALPRNGLEPLSITKNTELFTGTVDGQRVTGTARTFSRRCPPKPFEVTGRFEQNGRRLVLTGAAPNFGSECTSDGTRDEELVFYRTEQ
jgi:peptidyl-prolyl cis-trans isomerase C